MRKFLFFIIFFISTPVSAIEFKGKFIQGHFIIGKTNPNTKILIDKKQVKVTKDGYFAFGIGKDRKFDVVITEGNKSIVKKITLKALSEGIPKGTALNVNFPNLSEDRIKGIKVCNQANSYWIEKFDKRVNPQGREYYWLTGEFINNDKSTESDEWALNNGFVSIVPVKFDLTNYEAINSLKSWNL